MIEDFGFLMGREVARSLCQGFRGFVANGFGGGCGLGILAGQVHNLMTTFPLVLFHGVHHGVIVAMIGVEDFSPLFADFGDEWLVIHDYGLQRVRWVCRWSVRGIRGPGSLDPVAG